MATTRQGYAKALIERLRVLDPSHFYPGNLRTMDALVCWMVAEGGSAAWNPLNTTWRVEGHSKPLPGNTAGVQEYDSQAVGVDATARTLLGNSGKTYAVVLTALRAGWGAASVLQRVTQTPWGTHIEANSGGGRDTQEAVATFVAAVEERWMNDGGAFTYISED